MSDHMYNLCSNWNWRQRCTPWIVPLAAMWNLQSLKNNRKLSEMETIKKNCKKEIPVLVNMGNQRSSNNRKLAPHWQVQTWEVAADKIKASFADKSRKMLQLSDVQTKNKRSKARAATVVSKTTSAVSSVFNVKILCFSLLYMTVNWIFSGFAPLVRENKIFEDEILSFSQRK